MREWPPAAGGRRRRRWDPGERMKVFMGMAAANEDGNACEGDATGKSGEEEKGKR